MTPGEHLAQIMQEAKKLAVQKHLRTMKRADATGEEKAHAISELMKWKAQIPELVPVTAIYLQTELNKLQDK